MQLLKTRLKWYIVQKLCYHCKLCKYIIYQFCEALNPVTYAQFWPALHQNTFDGAQTQCGSLQHSHRLPSCICGRDESKKGLRRKGVGKGEGWVRERQREGRDKARRGVRERTGKGRGYDPLDNSPMLAGL